MRLDELDALKMVQNTLAYRKIMLIYFKIQKCMGCSKGATTLFITTLNIMTLSIMTLRIMGLLYDTKHNNALLSVAFYQLLY
jgi:hypothetical protein